MIYLHLTKIKDDIYTVGILNPGMRVFDIVMRTEYGTSYNSYIVRGKEKTALIDICHGSFTESYLENVSSVIPPEEIDYIIVNHTEPDHTGALAEFIKHCPKAVVYASRAGATFLKNITNNPDINIKTVSDGEELDLGGKTLKFIIAPFLHWSDSMFTYLPEDKLLFSCDFLGCHFCEPYVFDYKIKYGKGYEKVFEEYYYAIMNPFKQHVRNGLSKIKGLSIDMVCPSHGPILTKGNRLEYAVEKYTLWSAEEKRDKLLVPIFYVSAYGNTEKLAKAVKEGIDSVLADKAETEVYNIIEHDLTSLARLINECDAFAVGTPTINADALAPVWQLLSFVEAVNSRKKPAAVFGSYGWSGEGVPNIIARLKGLKMNVDDDGLKVCFVPSEDDLKKAKDYGAEFAKKIESK